MGRAILDVEADINAPLEVVRDWFVSLADHPERYAFETHQGFEFERGRFAEVGARFRTRERFLFLTLELQFELTEVSERSFSFQLLRPARMRIWGRFDIESRSEEQSRLALRLGSETRVGKLFLRCYPVAVVIRRQICGEVRHIKRSVEKTYGA